jgi:DNA/RNA-binding domain of Phe-tRNA-synthetase-like protein
MAASTRGSSAPAGVRTIAPPSRRIQVPVGGIQSMRGANGSAGSGRGAGGLGNGYVAAMLTIDPHPLLALSAFTATFPAPLGTVATPPDVLALLQDGAAAPMSSDDATRAAVRDLLRHGGFKPTGRSKPASEYLIKAAAEGILGPINAVVDACNAVSLHSGLPISVVDLDRAVLGDVGLRVGLAPADATYVFNASGQTIDVAGLLCLFDAEGPCANAVKDAQRTKTTPETRRTLVIVWGCTAVGDRVARAAAWYRALLEQAGATTAAM